jgi:cytochrome d ubiquinol oxidase subunit I
MEALDLARLHSPRQRFFIFSLCPLTLGLSVLVAIMQTIYWRTDNPLYRRMAKFWGKLSSSTSRWELLTGIVQEFRSA